MQLVLRSRHVVTPEGVRPAAVHVRDGVIREVTDFDDLPAGALPLDFGERVLFPGVVDTHVHVNEPGRTEWEGFETATRAAAAGGVTTLVDMPLNSVPATTTPEALRAKRRAAEGRTHVDVGFWGGVVPGNAFRLRPLREAGVGDEAIVDAIHVCVLFNIINRVADALGVEALTDEQLDRGADFILRSYY